MNLAGIKIEGSAVSGIASAITLPELDLCLDLGEATEQALRCGTILITHGHLDHFHGIVRHAYIRHMTGATPTRIVCQPRLKPLIFDLFTVIERFQKGRKPDFTVETISPGEELRLRKGLYVRPFETHHRIDSQGYVLIDRRQKLKPEFAGTPGAEIGRLRKDGVEVTEATDIPLLAYTGDTKASVFWVDSEIMRMALNAKVLVTECTFLGSEQSVAFAQKRGHVHLDELGGMANRFQNEAVLLVHFSQRYFNRLIESEMAKLPATLKNRAHYLPLP